MILTIPAPALRTALSTMLPLRRDWTEVGFMVEGPTEDPLRFFVGNGQVALICEVPGSGDLALPFSGRRGFCVLSGEDMRTLVGDVEEARGDIALHAHALGLSVAAPPGLRRILSATTGVDHGLSPRHWGPGHHIELPDFDPAAFLTEDPRYFAPDTVAAYWTPQALHIRNRAGFGPDGALGEDDRQADRLRHRTFPQNYPYPSNIPEFPGYPALNTPPGLLKMDADHLALARRFLGADRHVYARFHIYGTGLSVFSAGPRAVAIAPLRMLPEEIVAFTV